MSFESLCKALLISVLLGGCELLLLEDGFTSGAVVPPGSVLNARSIPARTLPDGDKHARDGNQTILDDILLPVIHRRVERASIQPLKDLRLPAGSTEIRVWSDFSRPLPRGLILRQSSAGMWAEYLPSLDEREQSSESNRRLSAPKHGWKALFAKLKGLGIYQLRGERDRDPRRAVVYHAIMVVVEIKTPHSYRAYRYSNLLHDERPDIVKLEKIIDFLAAEFGVEMY